MMDKKLLFSNDEIEIYEGACDNIYYRGEKCNYSFGSALTYNITCDMHLTEGGFIKNLWDAGKVIFMAAMQSDEYTSRKIITSREAFEEIFVTSVGVEIPLGFNFPQHFTQTVNEEGALLPFVDLAASRGLIQSKEAHLERNFNSFYAEVKQLCELYGVKLQYDGQNLKIPTNTLPLI